MKLIVEGMSCGHCIVAITSAIRLLDAAAEVEVDLAAATVSIANTDLSPAAASDALGEAGYEVVAVLDAAIGNSSAKPQSANACCGGCRG
ncbi:cation transporter [Lysobacter sp. BMK333-48F3]|uniref:heavy-metal-associated domain-containing protein n=1 Tax=Lysobacter sp. BMK333-48F3 TaxID=2867962 RepID=UPI001C8BF9C7|nr:cation transporter [Lysobacter sp. BMK333-48F3]MBX9403539.1 cation transporter [Lysobacter sp. BMK333-48F3]